MIRRFIQQALLVGLSCAGLVVPTRAAAVGADALTATLSHPIGEGDPASGSQYRITHWTAENGLPQNSIKALAQTPDGYLWIGTLKGLARFDGVRFKVFDRHNTPEMTHDSINDLAVDEKDGGLWIGEADGLLYYRDHRFEQYGRGSGSPHPVGNLRAARQGGVWFSPHPGQVALARGGKVTTWEFGSNRNEDSVHQLGEESPSQLLALVGGMGSYFAVNRFDLITKSLTPLSMPRVASRDEPACFSFFQDVDGSLWLCTSDGIWHGSEQTWTRITTRETRAGPWPQGVYQTRKGELWVTQFETNRISLQRPSQGRLQPFTAPELPAELNVTHLLEDREGNLWVGSTTGLFRLEPKRLRVYSRRNGLRSDDTQTVAEGPDGTIWVGTAEGISSIRDGNVENLRAPRKGDAWNRIGVFLADRQDAVWVGWPNHSLARFHSGDWQLQSAPREIGNVEDLKALFEDRQGRLWVGTGNAVLCREGGQWSCYTTNNGLSHGDVRVVYQDRKDGLWFGTYGGGLNHLQAGKFTAYKTSRGELNNRAWWIHEDADGVFWVGSEDGLNRFVPPDLTESRSPKTEVRNQQMRQDGGRFFTFTTQHGLGENVVNNIQEDEFGHLWLSGLRGIYRISRQELNEVAAGTRAQAGCVAYGEADGMLNSECNGGDNQPSGCKDRQGRIWFPTPQGVVMIDPKEMQQTESPPPVVIEQVRANGEVIFGDGGPNIEHPTSNIQPRTQIKPGGARVMELHYTANSLAAPERVAFKYRLDGYDRDWLWDDQNRRVAFYTNLRPGDYTFRVMARSPHGAWSTPSDPFAFHVAPHFWETWPFYASSGAAVLSAALGLHYRRVRGLHRVQVLEQQRALQEERSRIAKDLHDDLGANLTGLALQLDVMGGRSLSADAQESQLAALARTTRGLVDNMREVVWAMNPQHDNLESLASFLGQYTEQYLAAAGLRCRLELPVQAPLYPVDSQMRHQLFLVVKEALHNIVRHARASEVRLCLEQEHAELRLTVEDNGCGLPPNGARIPGHGLDNMRKRIAKLEGEFTATARPPQGTRLAIRVPLNSSSRSRPPA